MEMETLCPSSCFQNFSFSVQQTKYAKWTKEENKEFERALAIYDEETPDRWLKVAAMIPGKSISDVVRQYMELEADVCDIEAGLVPIPGYLTSSFTLEMVNNCGFDGFRKRPLTGRSGDQERKKGVPWTEDEHRRFLMGLEKHGKGDWRNISRNFVISKTSTQVASHAQKYFIRQNSGGKDKRRPSIHDITTVHLVDPTPSSNGDSPSHKSLITPTMVLNWTQPNDDGAVMVFGSTHVNPFMQYKYDIASHGLKLQRSAHLGTLNSLFQSIM
ncbi:Transcription factor DIVARICATA like [Actinidia chinensis var. chinensis]|uniref:Transcription factor DIVARICATA like n=1 Tax=Actinidia chinensis var. chinensis TaxID=1590841 RepID=A0A2R6PLH9_ACTCC|nr:Transcription factor DIVARICATA like [Actinidia chinensis var. chinensis]